MLLQKYSALKVYIVMSKGMLLHQHFLWHCMCEGCSKNMLVIGISRRKHLMSKQTLNDVYSYEEKDFDPAIKYVRSQSDETSLQ